jgi:hypothetical protein
VCSSDLVEPNGCPTLLQTQIDARLGGDMTATEALMVPKLLHTSMLVRGIPAGLLLAVPSAQLADRCRLAAGPDR